MKADASQSINKAATSKGDGSFVALWLGLLTRACGGEQGRTRRLSVVRAVREHTRSASEGEPCLRLFPLKRQTRKTEEHEKPARRPRDGNSTNHSRL